MMNKDAHWLLTEKYDGVATSDYFDDCQRLEAGEPLAYLIGHVPFLGCTIWLDSKPLIPRSETEFWTDHVIHHIKKSPYRDVTLQILDLCAGSGCIGVAIAKHLPLAHVDFNELEFTHLPTIKKNCQANDIVLGRVHIGAGNLFSELDPEVKYDHIVSNPPYIDPELNRTDLSVMAHEPAIALYGGAGGLALITAIILYAPDFLKPGGTIWVEHEPEQTAAIRDLAAKKFTVSTHRDQYHLERFSELVLQ